MPRLSRLGSYSFSLFDPVVTDRYGTKSGLVEITGKKPGYSSGTATSSFNRSAALGFVNNSDNRIFSVSIPRQELRLKCLSVHLG